MCACFVSGDAPRKLERYLDEALFAIDWWKQRGRLPEWVSEGTPDLKLHKEQALIACVESSRRKRSPCNVAPSHAMVRLSMSPLARQVRM